MMMVRKSTCRMVGFFEKVGAVPSTCGWGGASTAVNICVRYLSDIFFYKDMITVTHLE